MYSQRVLPSMQKCLRRTLSADMSSSSSKICLQINPSSIKGAPSSYQLDTFVQDQDEIITSNNEEEEEEEEEKKGAFDEIWSSILSNKKPDSVSGSGSDIPYVHPLVKRASSLSEKSLEICTESLGSETGSEEAGCQKSDLQDPNTNLNVTDTIQRETSTVEYDNSMDYKWAPQTPPKTMTSSPFPPPLPSLSHKMQSHRHGGNLVLEAVTVTVTAAATCLRSLRRDGRLLLTLASNSDDVVDSLDEDDHDQDDEKRKLTIEFVMEQKATFPMMIMSKVIGGEWRRPRNLNMTVIRDLEEDDNTDEIPAPAISPVNACEFYWRRNATSEVVVTDEKGNNSKWIVGRNGNKITAQAQSKAQVENAAEYLVPFLRGCKEPGRSLLFRGAHCIATS